MYHERQGVAVVPPTVPGAYLGIPEKGTMRKQKSIGMMLVSVCVCVCLCTACIVCTSALGRLIIDKLERASQQNVLSAIILELIKHLLKLQPHSRTGGTSCSLMSSSQRSINKNNNKNNRPLFQPGSLTFSEGSHTRSLMSFSYFSLVRS